MFLYTYNNDTDCDAVYVTDIEQNLLMLFTIVFPPKGCLLELLRSVILLELNYTINPQFYVFLHDSGYAIAVDKKP